MAQPCLYASLPIKRTMQALLYHKGTLAYTMQESATYQNIPHRCSPFSLCTLSSMPCYPWAGPCTHFSSIHLSSVIFYFGVNYIIWQELFWEDTIHVHSLETGSLKQTKVYIPQNLRTNDFIGLTYSEELLTGENMIQRQLYRQCPPQHGRQLLKNGNLEHTSQPTAQQVGECLFQMPEFI